MKSYFFVLFLFILLPLSGQNPFDIFPQIEHTDTLHGVVIPDPYHWMEDTRSPEVLKFISDENKKSLEAIKKTKELYKDFQREAKRRKIVTYPGRELLARPDADYTYYNVNKGKFRRYQLHYRKKRDDTESAELLLSGKEAVADKKGFRLMNYRLSDNQKKIAYVIANHTSLEAIVRIKYDRDSKTYDEEIHNAIYYEWLSDSTLIYTPYIKQIDAAKKVYIHRLGTPQSEDRLIYDEQENTFMVSVRFSNSRKYVFIETGDMFTSETHYLDVATGKLGIIQPRIKGHQYTVFHDPDDTVFYIKTNLNAPNGKIVTANINHPESKSWIDFLPESGAYIYMVYAAGNKDFVIHELIDNSMKLSLIDKETGNKYTVDFDDKTKAYSAQFVYFDP